MIFVIFSISKLGQEVFDSSRNSTKTYEKMSWNSKPHFKVAP